MTLLLDMVFDKRFYRPEQTGHIKAIEDLDDIIRGRNLDVPDSERRPIQDAYLSALARQQGLPGMREGIDRYVLTWDAIELMETLVKPILERHPVLPGLGDKHGALPGVPWPTDGGKGFWLETEPRSGGRLGLLVASELQDAVLFMYTNKLWQSVKVSFDGPFNVDVGEPFFKERDENVEPYGVLACKLMSTFGLISEPKILETRTVVPDAKLNKFRTKNGKKPLVEHRVVTIHLTRKEREEREQAEDHERRTGKRLHYVRPFLRHRLGRLEKVCGHYRGNASDGEIRVKHYKVKR